MSERLDRRRLVAQIQAGDRQVFEELYLLYFDRVHTYVRLMLEDDALAHAATQTAFRIALSELPAYRLESGSFEVWLCRFARRVVQGRAGGRGDSRAQEEAPPAARRGHDEATEPGLELPTIPDADILSLIKQLPPSERELVILRYMFGLDMPELAVIVERSTDEVSTGHQRALARLNRMLADRDRSRARSSNGSSARPRR